MLDSVESIALYNGVSKRAIQNRLKTMGWTPSDLVDLPYAGDFVAAYSDPDLLKKLYVDHVASKKPVKTVQANQAAKPTPTKPSNPSRKFVEVTKDDPIYCPYLHDPNNQDDIYESWKEIATPEQIATYTELGYSNPTHPTHWMPHLRAMLKKEGRRLNTEIFSHYADQSYEKIIANPKHPCCMAISERIMAGADPYDLHGPTEGETVWDVNERRRIAFEADQESARQLMAQNIIRANAIFSGEPAEDTDDY